MADILNELLHTDYTESKFRKTYQAFEKMMIANQSKFADSNAQIEEIKRQRRELEIEKVKFRDERNSLYKQYRELGRNDADYDILKRLLENNSKEEFTPNYTKINSDNDMIVCISDVHLGAKNNSYFGSYDSDIAKDRLEQYLSEILRIQKLHNSKNCYLSLLGDLINSNIHLTIQITNRENVIQQIQKVSEMLSSFTFELSKVFENIYISDVSGNHTRLGKKDDCLRDERTDTLIPWYMQAKLSSVENVFFLDTKYDDTIAYFNVRGNEFWMCHGDFDSFDESGVAKLVMLIGHKPSGGILYGHKHKCSYDNVSDVKIIRSGSFSGTGDDFCISKRIKGCASQMVCICDDKGIKTFYPVELN